MQGQLLRKEILVDGGIEHAGARSDGGTRQAFNQAGLTKAGGCRYMQRGAAKRADAGSDWGVGEADAGGTPEPVDGTMRDKARGFIEEAMADLALHANGKAQVCAVHGLAQIRREVCGALVDVAEGEESGEVTSEGVVGLVGVLVAVGDAVFAGWWLQKRRNACCARTIGTGDGHGQAMERGIVTELLVTLAGDAEAQEIVPVSFGSGLEGEAGVKVLICESAAGSHAVEGDGAGGGTGGEVVTQCESQRGGGRDVISNIGRVGGDVEGRGGGVVAGVKAGEAGQ